MAIKIEASKRLLAVKKLEAWAAKMYAPLKVARLKFDTGLGGMGSQDGCIITTEEAEIALEALKDAGFKMKEKPKGYFMFSSKEDKTKGICIDFEGEDDEECVISFYDESM